MRSFTSFSLLSTLALVAITATSVAARPSNVQASGAANGVASNVQLGTDKHVPRAVTADITHAVGNGHVDVAHGYETQVKRNGASLPTIHDDHVVVKAHSHDVTDTVGSAVDGAHRRDNSVPAVPGTPTIPPVPIRLGPQLGAKPAHKRRWGNFANAHVAGTTIEHDLGVSDGVQKRADVKLGVASTPHHARDAIAAQGSLPGVFTVTKDNIDPIIQQIVGLTSTGFTADVGVPLMGKVKDSLDEATAAVKALVNSPQETVFTFADKTVPVRDAALRLVSVFQTVVVELFSVRNAVSTTEEERVVPLITETGTSAANLVLAASDVSQELRTIVGPLLANFQQTLYGLSLGSVAESISAL